MKRKLTEFGEVEVKAFPELQKNHDDSYKAIKTITFQLTEECSLRCFAAGTKILMSDFTYKNIEDIIVGDEVLSFEENTEQYKQCKLVATPVTHTFVRHDYTRKIKTCDLEIITTDEHPFLTSHRQWVRAEKLVPKKSNILRFYGLDKCDKNIIDDNNYKVGYLIASFLGDGTLGWFTNGNLCEECKHYQNRFAVTDVELLERVAKFAGDLGFCITRKPFVVSKKYNQTVSAVFLNGKENTDKLRNLIVDNLNKNTNKEYLCGFLAGIIDTEGTLDTSIKIFNTNNAILKQTETAITALGHKFVYHKDHVTTNNICRTLYISNEDAKVINLLNLIQPAIPSKSATKFIGASYFKREQITENVPTNMYETVYNFETGTHTYIANNFMVHNCSYCYQGCKSPNHMTFEVAKEFIDQLFINRKNPAARINEFNSPGLVIDFIGGEPLLEIDLMSQIADYFESKLFENPDSPWLIHHRYSICSNGVAYFDPRVQKFLEDHEGFISMSITIDGCKELHDKCRLFPDGSPSYDLAIKAALDLLAKGQNGTKITQSPDNVGYTFAGIKNMIELGFTEIMVNPVYEEGWQIEHAKILYDQLKQVADYIISRDLQDDIYIRELDAENFYNKYNKTEDLEEKNRGWCGTTDCMYALDYKGDIYTCIRFMNSSLNGEAEPFVIGDLKNGIGGTDLYKSRLEELSHVNKTERSPEKCLNCPVESGCGGCLGYEYQHFHCFNKKAIYICGMQRAAALASKYFYKACKDKESYDKIEITWDFANDIIDEEEWKSLQWED